MVPGDKTPSRYSTRSKLSAAVLALIATGAGVNAIYQQFLVEKEGTRLVAYYDSAIPPIPTICSGLTRIYGRPVRMGDKLTADECKRLDGAEQAAGLVGMARMVKPEIWAGMSPAAQAGVASFCWHNIGAAKCGQSTFLRLLNAGERNAACAEITKWIHDGGRDCRVRGAGCFGQVERRLQEDELCLDGTR